MSYIHDQLKGKDREFISGFKLGIIAFAHWKNGVQHVGTCGRTLESVLVEIDEHLEEHQQDDK